MGSFRALLLLLLGASSLAQGAVDLNGSQVVLPVSDDDPSPIGDPLTYVPDQHDCPLPCSVDLANVYRWTPFYSLDRLKRCHLPMLVQFSVLHPLDDPSTDVLIRSCTLKPDQDTSRDRTILRAIATEIENPKLAADVFETSLDTAPACAVEGKEDDHQLTIMSREPSDEEGRQPDVNFLLAGMETFFTAKDNCDETLIFGRHNNITAGLYIGPGLGKKSVKPVAEALLSSKEASRAVTTVAEICSEGAKAERIIGLALNTKGDLVEAQNLAAGWSNGRCALPAFSLSTTVPVKVFDIAASPIERFANGTSTTTFGTNHTSAILAPRRSRPRPVRQTYNRLTQRATCKYIQVQPGDGCASLASKCGIKGADFMKYNPKANLCSTLQGGDYVCCSAGDPYAPPKPQPPKPGANGICATHVIKDDDTCDKLAKANGLTVAQIESFNKGKTWGWTECKGMMAKYNMCLSKGDPPLPPAQQGTQCGPMVPKTNWTDRSIPMAELNPCPLKACCSNWGYCGPFPAHCDVHAPAGGGPGTKLPNFQSTCISNCGNEIKQNSGPPFFYSRIGYYGSWNMGRKCLWLKAENANTDSSYTHIHWGFLEIDPKTWKPVIKDPHKQWQYFKMLANVRRIVSFGGWAYSTEPATYNIIRQAIINNHETFATNIAKFLQEEKLDGVDIDWEYPGAPDILVNGVPIGQPGDGAAYLRFLTTLKSKVGFERSVSIAAPASYWYLKAFPIDRIAGVIDYIVYMTYDLHGQWDYGNVNAFDSCPSGKCIRSHVNLTETRNTLSIITKAGVPNNKIFVGEASYGRSFNMAVDGCWGPMCDFTGSRTQSNAQPGRCTETRGYISLAEINEIIRNGEGRRFHDGASNSDILLYNGDYISYMTPITKRTRRADWEKLNFAGTIDWSVDLQEFRKEDAESPPKLPQPGETGCIAGDSWDSNAMDLCQVSCSYGFCPEPTCYCQIQGKVRAPPNVISRDEFISWDEFNPDMMRLCKFTCKHGFCPDHSCGKPVVDEWDDGSVDSGQSQVDDGLWNKEKNFQEDMWECRIFKKAELRDVSAHQCETPCFYAIQEAKAEGRTTNYGCIAKFPLDKEIPWELFAGKSHPDMLSVVGRCSCDNMLVNWIADTVVEALPIIAQIGCYIVMSAIKLVLDVGLQFIPGAGKILDAGMDAAAVAAQMLAYTYPPDQDPAGAFEWWLSPCGGSDLVPDEIKKVFDILSTLADGVSSYKRPKNIKPGSGKKGDPANPIDRSKPKAGTGSGPNGTGSSGVTKQKKCRIRKGHETKILGRARNTYQVQSCTGPPGGVKTTTKDMYVMTSLEFGPTPTTVNQVCSRAWSQACYHYSSAIAYNPAWAALPCVHGMSRYTDTRRPGVTTWYAQHHDSWLKDADREEEECHVDEYPPRYFLRDSDTEMVKAGEPGGQLMRFLPGKENTAAGRSWGGACFVPHLRAQFLGAGAEARWWDKWKNDRVGPETRTQVQVAKAQVWQTHAAVKIDVKPYFKLSKWEHESNPPKDAGMWENKCWPKKLTPNDPGFALWSWDDWYVKNPNHVRAFDYANPKP